jgi:hypothetical protein
VHTSGLSTYRNAIWLTRAMKQLKFLAMGIYVSYMTYKLLYIQKASKLSLPYSHYKIFKLTCHR